MTTKPGLNGKVKAPVRRELLAQRSWHTLTPASLSGEWRDLYTATVNALLERYAKRGPQYEMLCDLAAGLYVQVRRMEATGAIRGLDALDVQIARQLELLDGRGSDEEVQAAIEAAQHKLAEAAAAMKVYLQATEALRKLIEQAQRYTEARRQEVVVTAANEAVLETLRIVETFVDPVTFMQIVKAVRDGLGAQAA